jgi:hypothetical protein
MSIRSRPVAHAALISVRRRPHLASQKITIAKIGGSAADIAFLRLQYWAASRLVNDPFEWSSDQWPSGVRAEADAFADQLRANSVYPPIVYYVEWVDLWSMGDVYIHWLTPPGAAPPIAVYADRFELYAYSLPDGGCLVRHLATSGALQFDEYEDYVGHLLRAAEAWGELVDRAILVVLREVVGGLVTNDELTASLSVVPDWLTKD